MHVCNIYRDKELELAPKKGSSSGEIGKLKEATLALLLCYCMPCSSSVSFFFLCSRDGTLLYKERRVPPS